MREIKRFLKTRLVRMKIHSVLPVVGRKRWQSSENGGVRLHMRRKRVMLMQMVDMELRPLHRTVNAG